MTTRTLPEKKYFKIGEVADLVGVEPHVLRYWETQFPQVRPHKARSGHRLYRRREVETLLVIRELLHVQRFTIAGARQALRQPGGAQSLLPRFFDGSSSAAAAPAIEAPRDTLVPRAVDATDEEDGRDAARLARLDEPTADDVDGDASLFDAPGADSAEGDVVEVEAHALDREELQDALERDAAAGPARRTIVEVDVAADALDERPVRRTTALSLHPRNDRRNDLRNDLRNDRRVEHVEHAPRLGARRRLLEDALASAHAALAVLDREDSRDRAHA